MPRAIDFIARLTCELAESKDSRPNPKRTCDIEEASNVYNLLIFNFEEGERLPMNCYT